MSETYDEHRQHCSIRDGFVELCHENARFALRQEGNYGDVHWGWLDTQLCPTHAAKWAEEWDRRNITYSIRTLRAAHPVTGVNVLLPALFTRL